MLYALIVVAGTTVLEYRELARGSGSSGWSSGGSGYRGSGVAGGFGSSGGGHK